MAEVHYVVRIGVGRAVDADFDLEASAAQAEEGLFGERDDRQATS